jgi:hypothetical protein
MAASQKGPSKGKSPAKGKPASPEGLVKTGKKDKVELSEEELRKVAGGIGKLTKNFSWGV